VPKVLDDRYVEDVLDELKVSFDELTAEEIIPGLVAGIRHFAEQFPDPYQIIDEAMRLLEED
jgi:hypothetical protein